MLQKQPQEGNDLISFTSFLKIKYGKISQQVVRGLQQSKSLWGVGPLIEGHSVSNHPECPTSPTRICLKFCTVVMSHEEKKLPNFFLGQVVTNIRVVQVWPNSRDPAPLRAHISAPMAPREIILILLERYLKLLSGHPIKWTVTLSYWRNKH